MYQRPTLYTSYFKTCLFSFRKVAKFNKHAEVYKVPLM